MMKYIVMSDPEGLTPDIMIIFNKEINHDCMAESLEGIRNQTWGNWERVFRFPISAGFTDGTKCYGMSESLSLSAREKEDSELLRKQLFAQRGSIS